MKVVQIGSNKGNDDLSNYIKETKVNLEFGLFVEANPLHINDLRNCYEKYANAFIENVGIKPAYEQNNNMTIYYYTIDGPNYHVASCNKEHLKKFYYHADGHLEEIKEFSIPCISLDSLFEKYNITELDWLLVDVEGIDAEILLSTDWKKYNIKRIDYERLHLGNKKEQIEKMFSDLGYVKTTGLQYGCDDAWVKPEMPYNLSIENYAIENCKKDYLRENKNEDYIITLLNYYYDHNNLNETLRYGGEFLTISAPYFEKNRIDVFIKCSHALLQLNQVQASMSYSIHALSEAIKLNDYYIEKAFSNLFSLGVKIDNPNIIIFASGFLNPNANKIERKQSIQKLFNSIL